MTRLAHSGIRTLRSVTNFCKVIGSEAFATLQKTARFSITST